MDSDKIIQHLRDAIETAIEKLDPEMSALDIRELRDYLISKCESTNENQSD